MSNFAKLAFRYRIVIFLLFYGVGFLAPWNFLVSGPGEGTLWLGAPTLLARTGWLGVATATLVVTLAALACLLLGAILRVWGTAYLGAVVMQGTEMEGDRIVAGGPYRYLRNPLYLGAYLLAIGVSILMPFSGALFFIAAIGMFMLLLILSEERFLTEKLGAAYQAYCRKVPRLFPGFRRPRASASLGDPQWLSAVLAETYAIGILICFAIFAWQYNAHILLRCVLICYGLSLITRSLMKKAS